MSRKKVEDTKVEKPKKRTVKKEETKEVKIKEPKTLKKEEKKEEKIKEPKAIKKEVKEKKKVTRIKKEEEMLPKKDQKVLRILSRIIAVVSKILRVLLMIAVPIIAIVMIALPILFSKIEISGNIVKFNDIRFVLRDESISINAVSKTYLINNNIQNMDKIITFLNSNSVLMIMIDVELILLFSVIAMIITIYLLIYVEKLFGNIHRLPTPFTNENCHYIRLIGRMMIASIITTFVFEVIVAILVKDLFNVHFASYSIITILIVYIAYYIFKYATKLQEKETTKIYD